MSAINYLTAGQLNFTSEADGKFLRASVDNAAQNVFFQTIPPMYEAASGKLKTYMNPTNPQFVTDATVADAMKGLQDFNRDAFSSSTGATGSVDKTRMRTYLSLVHAMQPSEQELTAKGMNAGMAKAIAGATANSKTQVERALKVLQIDPVMTEGELQKNVPVLLTSLAQGKGSGIP